MSPRADAIIVGAGIAGIAAAVELLRAGRHVLLLERGSREDLGGQARWSAGDLLLVDSAEQRRLRVHDSRELAERDWFGSAEFDREEDATGIAWAGAFLDFATDELSGWLRERNLGLHPLVQWSDRGGDTASGPGSSVPRLHRVRGGGTALLAPLIAELSAGEDAGLVELRFGHRVDGLLTDSGAVTGVRASTDDGEVELHAATVVLAGGGASGDPDLVRAHWPDWLGAPPAELLVGAPPYADGGMHELARAVGAEVQCQDRMQLDVQGVTSTDPRWERHGVRLRAGPSGLWVDAEGRRLPAPHFPGSDPLGALGYLRRLGHDHSWLILNRALALRELDVDDHARAADFDLVPSLRRRLSTRIPEAIAAFLRDSDDVVTADTLDELVAEMIERSGSARLDAAALRREVEARDGAVANRYSKDAQLATVRASRRYPVDRLLHVGPPRPLGDPRRLPYLAIRLRPVVGGGLGGIRTDLSARALGADDSPITGLSAVGEAAGFGGGGMHGYRALGGSLLAASLFTGIVAGRALAHGE